jgi:PAS domain S-box-containing protein
MFSSTTSIEANHPEYGALEFWLKSFSIAMGAGWLLAISLRLLIFPEYAAGGDWRLLLSLIFGASAIALAWDRVWRRGFAWQYSIMALGLLQLLFIGLLSGPMTLWQLPIAAALCAITSYFYLQASIRNIRSAEETWKLIFISFLSISALIIIGLASSYVIEGEERQDHITYRSIFVSVCVYICWLIPIVMVKKGHNTRYIKNTVLSTGAILYFAVFNFFVYRFINKLNENSIYKINENFISQSIYINILYLTICIFFFWLIPNKYRNILLFSFAFYWVYLFSSNEILALLPSLSFIALLPFAMSIRSVGVASAIWATLSSIPLLYFSELTPHVVMSVIASTILYFGSHHYVKNIFYHETDDIKIDKNEYSNYTLFSNKYSILIGLSIFLSIFTIGGSFLYSFISDKDKFERQQVAGLFARFNRQIEAQLLLDQRVAEILAKTIDGQTSNPEAVTQQLAEMQRLAGAGHAIKLIDAPDAIIGEEKLAIRQTGQWLFQNNNGDPALIYEAPIYRNAAGTFRVGEARIQITIDLREYLTNLSQIDLSEYHLRFWILNPHEKESAYETILTSGDDFNFEKSRTSKFTFETARQNRSFEFRIDAKHRQSIWDVGIVARLQGLTMLAILMAFFGVWLRKSHLQNQNTRRDLSASEAFQRAFIGGAAGPIIVTNSAGLITLFNRAAETLLGYQAIEVVGMAPEMLFVQNNIDDRAHNDGGMEGNPFAQASAQWSPDLGGLVTHECNLIRKDGSRIAVILNVTHLLDGNDEIQHHLCFIHDISLLKAAQLARTQFIANVSHELRTPLNVVIGYARLLEQAILSELDRDRVRRLRLASELLSNLVGDVLDWSKIEAGEIDLEHIPFNVIERCSSIKEVMEDQASKKGLGLRFKFGKGLHADVVGDPVRFQQILYNLISNAIKFTDTGQISVSVRAIAALSPKNVRIKLEVRDTGIGIPKEYQPEIFERFRQVQEGLTRRYQGTGLGLAIVKELATLMHGQISLKSKPGVGSTFTVELEFGRYDQTALSRGDYDTASSEVDLGVLEGKHILLVDDSDMTTDLTEWLLHYSIEKVSVCKNGQEALDWLAAHDQPDAVLMDIQMPVMDGKTAVSIMRKDPKLRLLPVIAMTAGATKSNIQEALNSGMNDFVTKPFHPEKLNAILAKNISKSERYSHDA